MTQKHSTIKFLPWLSSALLLTACSSQKLNYQEQMNKAIRSEQVDSLGQKATKQKSEVAKSYLDECGLLIAEGETAWQLAQRDWGTALQQVVKAKPSPKTATEPIKKQVYYLKKTCHKTEATEQIRQEKVVEHKQWQLKNISVQSHQAKKTYVLPSVSMWLAISLGLGLTFILTLKYIK